MTIVVYSTNERNYEGADLGGNHRNSVEQHGDNLFRVVQEDREEDGSVWNVTPIRDFETLDDAIRFANE